jgi:peptidoglycan/xylan/chitin deacetylase (PgdA/CDA1 family)
MIKIVQCWDDGVEDDIRLCEILRAHGAKASFNLNPGLHGSVRGGAWRYKDVKDVRRLAWRELPAVYKGFTVANHTTSHPWPTKVSAGQWQREVREARKALQDHFQQPVSGFAYPYGDFDDAVAETVREAGHVYARTCHNATPCLPAADPMKLPSDCHHAATDFWDRYAKAKAAGAPAFYFWGHSYEFLGEADWSAFGAKLARFNADSDAVWADLPDLFV